MATTEMGMVDFSLVVTSESLAENAKSQLAFLNNTRPSQVDEETMEILYQNKGSTLSAIWLAVNSSQPLDMREFTEKSQSQTQFAETLLDKPTNFLSYGMHAPLFLHGLERHKKETAQNTSSYKSLLVGSLTPSTTTEFAVITRHIFPNAKLQVMDIEVSDDTINACVANGAEFYKGNCL